MRQPRSNSITKFAQFLMHSLRGIQLFAFLLQCQRVAGDNFYDVAAYEFNNAPDQFVRLGWRTTKVLKGVAPAIETQGCNVTRVDPEDIVNGLKTIWNVTDHLCAIGGDAKRGYAVDVAYPGSQLPLTEAAHSGMACIIDAIDTQTCDERSGLDVAYYLLGGMALLCCFYQLSRFYDWAMIKMANTHLTPHPQPEPARRTQTRSTVSLTLIEEGGPENGVPLEEAAPKPYRPSTLGRSYQNV